jgi:hypothetical protein
MFGWLSWLKDADNRGVVTVLVSTMALFLSVVAYIWPRKPREKEASGARRQRPPSSEPLSENILLKRGLPMSVGILAILGVGYGVYKAVSFEVVHYTACLGEYERNCGFSHDVYLYCDTNVEAYFKDKCVSVTARSIGSHDGNKCGYTNVSVLCTQRKP